MNKQKLTEDLIPDNYTWAAVDSYGRAYAFTNRPKLTDYFWQIDHETKDFTIANEEIYLGLDFCNENWKESLIIKHKRLKAQDIPSGFTYAAIDSDGQAYAYKSKPFIFGNNWKSSDNDSYGHPLGSFHTEDWKNSLIQLQEKNYNQKVLTADDIPDGYNYAAVDSDSATYAYIEKPKALNSFWNWPYNSERVYIGRYNTTDWKNSLVSREDTAQSKLKQLTIEDIPEGYIYGTIDSDGTAFAHKIKPKIHNTGNYWINDPEACKEIGYGYEASNWRDSLVSKKKTLTVDDIPDGYNYAVVDYDGIAFACDEIPKFFGDEDEWDFLTMKKLTQIGDDYDATNWKQSLVTKKSLDVNGIISKESDYSKINNISGFDYAKLNNLSNFDYAKLNSIPFGDNFQKNDLDINLNLNKIYNMENKQESAIEYCESRFPEMTNEFKKIQQEMYETFCKKQRNYGPANIAVGTPLKTPDDIKISLTGIWFRINDKIQRLKQLVVLGQPDEVGESIQDTYQDMSVYGIIAQIVSRGKWAK